MCLYPDTIKSCYNLYAQQLILSEITSLRNGEIWDVGMFLWFQFSKSTIMVSFCFVFFTSVMAVLCASCYNNWPWYTRVDCIRFLSFIQVLHTVYDISKLCITTSFRKPPPRWDFTISVSVMLTMLYFSHLLLPWQLNVLFCVLKNVFLTFSSFVPERCGCNSKCMYNYNFKHILAIDIMNIFSESQNPSIDNLLNIGSGDGLVLATSHTQTIVSSSLSLSPSAAYIYASVNCVSIGSDNGLSPIWHQVII